MTTQINKAIDTIFFYLKRRKYEFVERLDESQYLFRKADEKTCIFIFPFLGIKKLSQKMLTEMVKKYKTSFTNIIIIVEQIPITLSYDTNVQVYILKELQVNVLKHYFVPTAYIVSSDFQKKLQNQYKHFPHISQKDPVAKALHLKKGQLCMFIRKNGDKYFRKLI